MLLIALSIGIGIAMVGGLATLGLPALVAYVYTMPSSTPNLIVLERLWLRVAVAAGICSPPAGCPVDRNVC